MTPRVSKRFGCVSRTGVCSDAVDECRTVDRSSVAEIFCSCSPICVGVGTFQDESSFLRCRPGDEPPSLAKPVPVYCKIMSFL